MRNLLLVILFAPGLVLAQSAPIDAPPSLPLIKRAPVPIQWIITNKLQSGGTGAKDAKNQTPAPRAVTLVVKTAGLVYEKSSNENGVITERWFYDGQAAIRIGGTGIEVDSASGGDFESPNFSKEDFAGFDWISPGNFKETQTLMGRKLLVFKDKFLVMNSKDLRARRDMAEEAMMTAKMTGLVDKSGHLKKGARLPTTAEPFDPDKFKSEVTACIDEETRLPVYLIYKNGGTTVTRLYQFQPATVKVSVPAEAKVAVEKQKSREKRLSVTRAPLF